MFWMCQIFFIFTLSFQGWAEISNKNPFEPLIGNQKVTTAREFVRLTETKQNTFLKSLPEYSKRLKGIQSHGLQKEFRKAKYFYHKAILNFINQNIKQFISLNPTPRQVNLVLKRATVQPPVILFDNHRTLIDKAFNIQEKLLNHFISKAGKIEAISILLDYDPVDVGLNQNRTHIVERHIGHLTEIGLIDNIHMLKDFNLQKPFFFDSVSYLKHFFHYPFLSPEQKAKKLISILLNTLEDVQIDFLKHKKDLIRSGVKVSSDYLDETNSLQYLNAKMQAKFLQGQMLLVLKSYLDRHFLTLNLNQHDFERLLKITNKHGYNLDFYKNKLIGLSEKPSLIKRLTNIVFSNPVVNRSKICFLIFN